MGSIVSDQDTAVIWRGPRKGGAIRQLLGDVNWGPLDYLIIDAPPGTGDEPLSVAQTIPGVKAVVVTTPQQVAIRDVRRSLKFLNKVGLPVLGIIENMSGLTCPHCGKEIALFKGGWPGPGHRMGRSFLGRIPLLIPGWLKRPMPDCLSLKGMRTPSSGRPFSRLPGRLFKAAADCDRKPAEDKHHFLEK